MRLNNLKKLPQKQILFILAAINAIALIAVYGVIFTPDSDSYFQAWKTSYIIGEISPSRTPIYPIILGVIGELFGKWIGVWIVVLLQFCLFLYSITCFWKICSFLFKNNKIIFFSTLFYAIYPGFTNWNLYILTESLALSLSVIQLYFLMMVIKSGSKRHLLGSACCLLLMVFLRPSFIYLLPISFVAFLLLFFVSKSLRKVSVLGIVLTVIITGCMLQYMSAYEEKYGLFSTSDVNVTNQYYLARQYGVLDPNVIEDVRLRDYIKKDLSLNGVKSDSREFLWYNTHKVFENFDVTTVNEAVKASVSNHPGIWLQGLAERCYFAVRHPLFKTPINSWGFILNLIGPSINTLVFMLLLYTIFILYFFTKKKRLPWYSFVLYMIICSNLIVIIIGAQDEYSRLLLPSLPIAVIFFGQLLESIKTRQIIIK